MENHFDANELRIVDFRIIKGEIDAQFEFKLGAVFNFETNMSFDASFDIKTKSIRADMGFEIETVSDNEQREAKAKFDFVFIYEVGNLEDLVEEKKGKITNINNNLMVSTAAIAFSTSRGILMTRLQGTAMKDYILPVIDPEDLLKED